MMVLEEKKISDSGARMGRPPLGETASDTMATLVRFEQDMVDRVKHALLPGEKRAAFIREAVERELQRRGK
jgi:hypothetical protein